ncbi:MAG: phosphatase PAP2 family protein [Ornithinimicrobium sp.]
MSETPVSTRVVQPSSARSWWGTPLLAPVLMVLAGPTVAIVLTDGASENGDLSAYDPAITSAFVTARSDVGTALAQVFTFFGSTLALVPLTLAVLAWLGWRRRWQAMSAVVAGMVTSLALTVLLKNVIGRVRPPGVDVLGAINTGFSFPSGHTLNGTVFFGLVTGLVLHQCRSLRTRLAALTGGVVMAVGIGLSRVYLGYHWLTDVMAGWSLAVGVLGVVLLGSGLLDRRRSRTAHV